MGSTCHTQYCSEYRRTNFMLMESNNDCKGGSNSISITENQEE